MVGRRSWDSKAEALVLWMYVHGDRIAACSLPSLDSGPTSWTRVSRLTAGLASKECPTVTQMWRMPNLGSGPSESPLSLRRPQCQRLAYDRAGAAHARSTQAWNIHASMVASCYICSAH